MVHSGSLSAGAVAPGVSKRVAQVAVFVPLRSLFSYSFGPEDEQKLVPGVRVVVPFRNRESLGVFTGFGETDIKTKRIKAVLDDKPPFGAGLISLVNWAAEYYLSAPGELFRMIGPRESLKKKVTYHSSGKAPGRIGEEKRRILDAATREITAQTLANKTGLTPGGLEKTARSLVKAGLLERREEYYFTTPGAPPEEIKTAASAFSKTAYTAEQKAAIDRIASTMTAGKGEVTLLEGVTGSGKTEVYMALCRRALESGGGAIVLVPEIALTYQFVRRFEGRFGKEVAVLHSGLTPAQRRNEWTRVAEGKARIVIGARSAIFAPMESLRLIVVDEEHDASYKQTENPRYNARDLAVVLGKICNASVVLGSATPSLETAHNARTGKYRHCRLTQRIDGRSMPPVTAVMDGAGDDNPVPALVVEKIMDRLGRGEQSLVFINRRGSSFSVKCRICRAALQCPNCSISLTHHSSGGRLLCHYCAYEVPVPRACPSCGAAELFSFRGAGTQKVEDFLATLIPKARIERLDQDTAPDREKAFAILGRFERGETDVLVGTQMTAKGHDFPNLTFTAILSADDYLLFPDFRSAERTFSLATQAAGRTGRGNKTGEVVICGSGGHYAIRHAMSHDYDSFYHDEMESRRKTGFPPFSRLVGMIFDSPDAARLEKTMRALAAKMPLPTPGVEALGPVEALVHKVRNRYRWKLLLKGKNPKNLRSAALQIEAAVAPDATVAIDVDPYGFF